MGKILFIFFQVGQKLLIDFQLLWILMTSTVICIYLNSSLRTTGTSNFRAFDSILLKNHKKIGITLSYENKQGLY